LSDDRPSEDTVDHREELRRQEETSAKRQHAKGKLTARERIAALLDQGSFVELDPYVKHQAVALGMDKRKWLGDGVVTGSGSVDGKQVYVYAQDFGFMGGSLGAAHARKICRVLDLAIQNGAPIIGFHDSGGARIQEGVASLGGYGEIFRRNVQASGVIPQIAVIAGPTAGGASYSPALMDFTLMVEGIATMFITGPRVVKQVTGEEVDPETLGGAEIHGSVTGVASLTVGSEAEAIEAVRAILSYLPPNNLDAPVQAISSEPSRDAEGVIPDESSQAYDTHDLIDAITDAGSFFEIQPSYAMNAVVGFGRLGGRSIGVVASQPSVMAGTMTIDSSDKISRFVRLCDAFNLPVLTLQDVPGYIPGVDQEHRGIIRHGAKVIYAYSEATVPKVTVILRKSYGGAYIALGSKHLGTDFVYALPGAEVAVMGAEGAVEIVYRREIAAEPEKRGELIAKYQEEFSNPYQAAKLGFIDDVIEPGEIRSKVIAAFESLSKKRVKVHPPKKHGNMPV
jgi:acetyl-CoA carboxylase carboxyltransferase component